MNRTFLFTIEECDDKKAIDLFLKSHGFSRHILSRLKNHENGILLNGNHATTKTLLSSGDCLSICILEETSSQNIVPINLPMDIVYEDQDILVINKASDTPIHPSLNNFDNSLANGVSYYYQNQDSPFVFRCINRLDRDTTGLTIIAKNPLSGAILSSMVSRREIHREYLAICSGQTPPLGTVNAPIGRVSHSCIEREVNYECGERAVTHFETLNYLPDSQLSLVKLKLETGRTHQIRVHMKHIGHPLIGDYIYHPDYTYIKRQALHSYHLSFLHPISQKPMNFTAELPSDMARLLL